MNAARKLLRSDVFFKLASSRSKPIALAGQRRANYLCPYFYLRHNSSSPIVNPPKVTDLNNVMQAQGIDVTKLTNINGWQDLWNKNFAPWHKTDVNPKLVTHLATVLTASGAKQDHPDEVRFFVPLCGKSVDMKFLYDQGFSVIGCEGVEVACTEFFDEQKLEVRRTEKFSGFPTFETPDGRLKIICGDFFALTPEILGGPVNCVWDRGSFVAIDPSMRQKYAETMGRVLSDVFGYLLVSIERQFEGPNMMPHSVSFENAIQFFGNFCTVKVLEQLVDPGTPESGYTKDNAFLLSRKINDEERLNYWQGRWVKQDAPWHHQKPNEFLVKYLETMKDGREHVRIFLPLCGKALDLFWLYQQGHTVVGLEGIPYVAEQVFQEANLEYTKIYMPEIEGFIFKTPDEKLIVYSCDLFKMRPEILGKFEAIFDRGSFEAIEKTDREAYANFMFQILSPKFRYILNGNEYDDSGEFRGPPRNVPRKQVFRLFQQTTPEGMKTTAKILEERDETETGRNRFKLDKMIKCVYLIQNV